MLLQGVKKHFLVLREWNDLPDFMKVPEVLPYYKILDQKRASIVIKRVFDISMASVLLALLLLPMIGIGVLIKLDSRGPIFYRQERITAYGKRFRVHKFRTMVDRADQIGSSVTVKKDSRITKVGLVLRKYRLDELPQLLDIIGGDMSFVGTRPEVARYVKHYSPEMRATLLMPAGVTSEASIRYKDESRLLDVAEDVDTVYVEKILPAKMMWNLESIRKFGLLRELFTCIRTIIAVMGKDCT